MTMNMTEEMTAPEKGAPWIEAGFTAEEIAEHKADWEISVAREEMTVWYEDEEYTVTPEGGVECFHNEPEIGAYGWRPVDEPEVVAEVMAMWEGKR